jgi:hypothetical protein
VIKTTTIVSNSPLPDGEKGISYSATLTAVDGTEPYIWSAGGLPNGLTISTSGVIGGTPVSYGEFSVVEINTDSFTPNGSDNTTFSLHIYDAIQIGPTNLPEALQNKTYQYTSW